MQLNPDSAASLDASVNYKVVSENMEALWKENGVAVLKTLEEITGLTFKQKEITCYLNSGKTFSDPLTLKVEDLKDMWDNLMHELVHVLLEDNEYGFTPEWKAYMEKLKQWHFTVRVHVPVNSVHLKLTQKLFPDRVERIKTYSVLPRYIKAWALIDETGADSVLKEVFGK